MYYFLEKLEGKNFEGKVAKKGIFHILIKCDKKIFLQYFCKISFFCLGTFSRPFHLLKRDHISCHYQSHHKKTLKRHLNYVNVPINGRFDFK